MSDAELQEEEREVLLSIYDGDPAFKQMTPTTFQYKVHNSLPLQIYEVMLCLLCNDFFFFFTLCTQYGEDNDTKSFLLEISWGARYPTEKPTINMNTFYNKHM